MKILAFAKHYEVENEVSVPAKKRIYRNNKATKIGVTACQKCFQHEFLWRNKK